MAIHTELTVRVQNVPGALGRLCQVLADEHVNIVALSLEPTGTLHLLVDNPVHAAGLLRDRHYTVSERDVLYTVSPASPAIAILGAPGDGTSIAPYTMSRKPQGHSSTHFLQPSHVSSLIL